MSEIEKILELWRQCEQRGEDAVLATVVKTQGSSYRMPGARLLVTQGGVRAGSVSGGCLEDDLIKKAWWLTETGPMIRRYDTTPDGEIATEFGLGCNGIIHILLERVRPADAIFNLFRETRTTRQPALVAHLIKPPENVGARLVRDPAGRLTHNLNIGLAASLQLAAEAALADLSGSISWSDGSCEALLETIAPPIRLLISEPVMTRLRSQAWPST